MSLLKNPGFYIKLDDCKFIINILKSLNFKELGTVFASKDGLKITVEDCKCIQGNLFLQHSLFQLHKISQKCFTFKINLNILIECLSIFGSSTSGSSTSLIMSYETSEDCLELFLEEDGVVTDCQIRTMDAIEILDFNFSSSKIINKIIMKSEYLKYIFKEIDQTSDIIQFSVSSSNFRISTFGDGGSTVFDFPKDSDEIECFESCQTRSIHYKSSLLRNMFKVLFISDKISIRTNEENFLSMQFMINVENKSTCFVEFFCVPDEDDDDYEDDTNE